MKKKTLGKEMWLCEKITGELDTFLSFPSDIMMILSLNFSEYPVWDAWSVADWTLPRTTVANVNLLWTVKGLYKEALTKDMRKQRLVVSCLWLGVCAKVILIAV